jgi:hypothetical protein
MNALIALLALGLAPQDMRLVRHWAWAIQQFGYECQLPLLGHTAEPDDGIWDVTCWNQHRFEFVTTVDSLGRYNSRLRIATYKMVQADHALRKAGQPLTWIR